MYADNNGRPGPARLTARKAGEASRPIYNADNNCGPNLIFMSQSDLRSESTGHCGESLRSFQRFIVPHDDDDEPREFDDSTKDPCGNFFFSQIVSQNFFGIRKKLIK